MYQYAKNYDLTMDIPQYTIPDCENLQVIVNRAALGLLMNPGTAVSSPALATSDAYGRSYYKHLKSLSKDVAAGGDYMALSAYYVYNGCAFEYVFLLCRCGRCRICRHSKQLDIINRCRMESSCYSCPPYMITLTYDQANLPVHRPECRRRGVLVNTLYYKDIQDFFKRLRIRWTRAGLQHNIRYMVAGEYGSKRGRPHYHIILWNNPYNTSEWSSPFTAARDVINNRKLYDDVWNAWGRSSSFDAFQCEPAGDGAAAYCSKYMTKAAVVGSDVFRDGRKAPFVRCSNRDGGIGSPCIARHAAYYRANPKCQEFRYMDYDGVVREVPVTSFISSKLWPSASRQVPPSYKRLFRSLVDAGTAAVEYGLMSLAELKSVLNHYRCGCLYYQIDIPDREHNKRSSLYAFAVTRIADCYNQLLDELDDFAPISTTIEPHYTHRLAVHQDAASTGLAQSIFKVMKKIALMDSREIL